MKSILLDQGLPAVTAIILRERGWDAIHVREIDMRSAADSNIIAFAVAQSRTVVTLDRDFSQFLALTAALRPSVVLIRQQGLKGAEVAALLEAVWLDHEAVLDQGCVLKVTPRGTRARLLPLR